eukprot:5851672-Prymnesium_polylepis.1
MSQLHRGVTLQHDAAGEHGRAQKLLMRAAGNVLVEQQHGLVLRCAEHTAPVPIAETHHHGLRVAVQALHRLLYARTEHHGCVPSGVPLFCRHCRLETDDDEACS